MRAARAWLSIPLLLLSLAAQADEAPLDEPEPSARSHALLSERLTRLERPGAFDALSATRDWRRLRIRKGSGLEYRRELRVGEREVVFGVQGPLMRKKRLGVGVEIRF